MEFESLAAGYFLKLVNASVLGPVRTSSTTNNVPSGIRLMLAMIGRFRSVRAP